MRISRTSRLLASGAFVLMMFAGQSAHAAVEVAHNLALNAGESKTFNGTWRGLGANVNYNGLVSEPSGQCTVTNPGDFDYDPRTLCEYAKISVTNPVPDADADGKVKKNLSITINSYAVPAPGTDFDIRVFATDAEGNYLGEELGASANTDLQDPDEQVVLSVETTRSPLVSTKHYLLEIAYFTVQPVDLCALPAEVRPNPCAPYKGTVQF